MFLGISLVSSGRENKQFLISLKDGSVSSVQWQVKVPGLFFLCTKLSYIVVISMKAFSYVDWMAICLKVYPHPRGFHSFFDKQ